MNLTNFSEHIDPQICRRGKEYYNDGSIISLEFDDGVWLAEVEGSEDYEVEVSLDENNNIIETSCNCPYDWGEFCKHQVAVFHALRKTPRQEPIEKETLESILNELDKPTLVSILLNYAKKVRQIKADLRMRYSKNDGITANARQNIHTSINSVMRQGFVEYRDTRMAIKGAGQILEMVEGLLDKNELKTVIELCIVLNEEMIELISCADDSNGDIGGIIGSAIGFTNDAVELLDVRSELAKECFDLVLNHSKNDIFDGWSDFVFDILKTLIPLCGNSILREKFENTLISMKKEGNDWMDNYYNEEIAKIQEDIVKRVDNTK